MVALRTISGPWPTAAVSPSARRNRAAALVAHVTPPARDPVEPHAGGVHAAASPRPTATPARERVMATEGHPTRSDSVTSGFKKMLRWVYGRV